MHNSFESFNRSNYFDLVVVAALFFITCAMADAANTATLRVSAIIGEPLDASPLVPQEWIDEFFGSLGGGYDVTLESDYDGDGEPDYLEYYAGSDPTDGASYLKVEQSELAGEDMMVTWTSADPDLEPLRRYAVFRANSGALSALADTNVTVQGLKDLSEVPESGIVFLGEFVSEGMTTTITDFNIKSQLPQFYRVFLIEPVP